MSSASSRGTSPSDRRSGASDSLGSQVISYATAPSEPEDDGIEEIEAYTPYTHTKERQAEEARRGYPQPNGPPPRAYAFHPGYIPYGYRSPEWRPPPRNYAYDVPHMGYGSRFDVPPMAAGPSGGYYSPYGSPPYPSARYWPPRHESPPYGPPRHESKNPRSGDTSRHEHEGPRNSHGQAFDDCDFGGDYPTGYERNYRRHNDIDYGRKPLSRKTNYGRG